MPNPLIKQVLIEDTDTLYDVYDTSADHGGGGGGDTPFRLINTITVSEDAEMLFITQDSNGNSFSLKEIWLEFDLAAQAAQRTMIMIFGINNPTNMYKGISDLICQYVNNTNKSWLRVHMELRGGCLFSDAEYGSTASIYNPTPTSNRISKDAHRIGGNYTEFGIARNAITSFGMRCDNGAYIMAGTVIKMLGR